MLLGIEIGGTKTQVGIGTAANGLLPNGIVRRAVNQENGATGILRDVASLVEELLASKQLSLSDISKIGISEGVLPL